MSEASQTRVKEMPTGKRAMEECDPLGLLTCVVATHTSNKRYEETYNIITALSNFYNNKMTQNEDLAAYYSRCRTLLFVKNEAYRLASSSICHFQFLILHRPRRSIGQSERQQRLTGSSIETVHV